MCCVVAGTSPVARSSPAYLEVSLKRLPVCGRAGCIELVNSSCGLCGMLCAIMLFIDSMIAF